MSKPTRDGTAEHVLRDQIHRREPERGNIHFPCSADTNRIGNLTRLLITLAILGDDHIHTYIHTKMHTYMIRGFRNKYP